jgi:multiple sugar transport system ATP-binding protein
MAAIEIQGVTKRFGKAGNAAVDNVSLSIADNEFMVLLGPSGCGKTTLLRCIVGLEGFDEGRIIIGGRDVTGLPPRRRNISMVFQNYAVFPHMTVFDNIAFGLRNQKVPEAEVATRVRDAAELLHITELLERKPAAASGGQRQRIALARAIAVKADVLLMDEPLSNLDALLRMEMRAELKKLMRELGVTVVYVTHDQIEALSMGDRIAVMRSGKLLQCAAPLDVYDRPADRFVGSFIGNPPMNFLPATVRDGRVQVGGGSIGDAPSGSVAGGSLTMGVRAENLTVDEQPGSNSFPVHVNVAEPLGSQNLYTVTAGDGTVMKVSTRPEVLLAPGSTVHVSPMAGKVTWFDSSTGAALAR